VTSLDPSKRQPQSNQTLSEHIKPQNSPLAIANVKLFPRPLSAFARQRTHHLSDIRKECLGHQEAVQYAESLLISRMGLMKLR